MTFRTNLLQIGHIYRVVNVQPRPIEHSFDSRAAVQCCATSYEYLNNLKSDIKHEL
jgi:hypothetical protein